MAMNHIELSSHERLFTVIALEKYCDLLIFFLTFFEILSVIV